MRTSIGVGVSCDAIRMLAIRRGRVVWATVAPREEGRSLETLIADLFTAAPIGRWRHPSVKVAVGPTASQLKRLTGLPPLRDASALEKLVREGQGRFFLRNGIPLVVTGLEAIESG